MTGHLGVGVEYGRAGDMGLDTRWGRHGVDNVAHRGHRFMAGTGALRTIEEDLHIGGPAVHTLGACRGQRIAPEVLDVLHVLVIGLELGDDVVVVLVRAVAQFVVAFQNDHRRGVRVVLLEHLADVQHPLIRLGILRTQRHRPASRHVSQRRGHRAQNDRERHPEQDDRQRENPDQMAEERAVRLCVQIAHTDFTKQ
ncbi:Uncharacterised protein [Mycobacteroides abscessus subsp. massiliense]|nr:Uncharacterised protein [Mycobacteroides abscessus subsp. massiliense]